MTFLHSLTFRITPMKKFLLPLLAVPLILSSCVAKKDYVELETRYYETVADRDKVKAERDELQSEVDAIQARVDRYNARILELQDANDESLQQYDKVVLSKKDKERMKEMLANVDPDELAQAKTLNDSINLILSKNLHKKAKELDESDTGDDFNVNIDDTVVMITIADNLLFKLGSYRLDPKAHPFLDKLAGLINSEPAIEVVIEGHTDNTKVRRGSALKDNWHLSAERSMSVVRYLIEKQDVAPGQLVVAGRGSSRPIYKNDTPENRAKNRRTRVVILPDLDKFYALLFAELDY